MNQYDMQQLPYGMPPQGPPPLGPPQPPQPPEDAHRQKKQRISRACDRCHARSTKCVPGLEREFPCQTCINYGAACTDDRPRQKRGMKAKDTPPRHALRDGEHDAKLLLDIGHGAQEDRNRNNAPTHEKFQGFAVRNQAQIHLLVEAFIELIYPVYPFFHLPTLRRKVQSQDYLRETPFFAELMSICTFAAVKARDASLSGPWTETILAISPEGFWRAAEESVPEDLNETSSLDWMRTCALLSLYGLHENRLNIMHTYMGKYLSIVAMYSLHDESNWPVNMGIVEVEMRRRLFWSMYTLEVYNAIVFGHTIRFRARNTNVCDPSEVEDDFVSNQGYNPPGSLAPYHTSKPIVDPLCWLYGWNFNVELFRVLEYCINSAPSNQSTARRNQFNMPDPNRENNILSSIIPMYENLPARFKNPPKDGENIAAPLHFQLPDRSSIQAASITTTLQLIRLVLFNTRKNVNSIEDQHAMASSLIDSLYQVPTLSQKIISTTMIHHFAGVAALLRSVMRLPVSHVRYRRLRDDLTALATIFAQIEEGVPALNPLTNSINQKITFLETYVSNPQNTLTHPQVRSLSSSGSPVIDPSLRDVPAGSNGDANGNAKADNHQDGMIMGGGGEVKRYDVLTAGGSYDGARSKGMKFSGDAVYGADGHGHGQGGGEEEVDVTVDGFFLLPGEVVEEWVWGLTFDIGRGFGARR